MTQKEKTKFRNTKEWKQFRARIQSEQKNLDLITNKPLRKGSNLHHKDLNSNHYTDLRDESHFIFVNKSTHEVIHTLFRYYKKDKGVLDRLKVVLDEMCELNQ